MLLHLELNYQEPSYPLEFAISHFFPFIFNELEQVGASCFTVRRKKGTQHLLLWGPVFSTHLTLLNFGILRLLQSIKFFFFLNVDWENPLTLLLPLCMGASTCWVFFPKAKPKSSLKWCDSKIHAENKWTRKSNSIYSNNRSGEKVEPMEY